MKVLTTVKPGTKQFVCALRIRCNDFPAPTTENDIRGILGDTKDPQFPIYRVATKFDPLDTAVTVIFDLVNKHASVWDNNPKLNPPGILIPLN